MELSANEGQIFRHSVYCVMPRPSKPRDTCKLGGLKLQGILQLLQQFPFHRFLEHETVNCITFCRNQAPTNRGALN